MSEDRRNLDPTEAGAEPRAAQEQIGQYRLLEQLGEGGMGEVWLAEQSEPVRRRVALKIIKQGMDTKQVVARFEIERQALALMDHPAVAKVFDAGTTPRGRPYFVMEYVRGVPITEYCDRHRLSNRERLELFRQVCEGVQHAHQKAIIHRDLKPSNVMVTEQDDKLLPKIIDFGVAKATAQKLTERTMFTELGVLIGTPEYMSPEQAELTGEDVDTRTDIYSLGVMLYELLVGVLPFDPKQLRSGGFEGISRRILEDEPPKPSTRLSTLGDAASASARARRADLMTLQHQLKGDLDWIIMRAMEKDRTRRYASPMELAADIGRYLADEPVLASPPSPAYRAGKFVRRHRFGVLSVAAGMVMLLAFAVSMALQARRIASERDRAEQANADLESVVAFQSGMLSEMDTEGVGRRLMQDLRSRVGEVARRRGLSEPEAEALMRSFGDAVRGVNATDAALRLIDEEILSRAIDTLEEEFSEQPLIDAQLRRTIGVTYEGLGLYPAAEPQLRRALDIRKRALGSEHPDTLRSMSNLANLYRSQGNYDESEPLHLEALDAYERTLGREHPSTLGSMHDLANLYQSQGRYDDAEPLYLESLETRKRVLGDDHPDTLNSMNNLASLYQAMGRDDAAEPLHVETLETCQRVLGGDHPDTLDSMNDLARLYQGQGRYDDAELLYLESLETRRRVLGDGHPSTLSSMNNLATLYWAQKRYDDAEPLHLEAIETKKRVLGNDHPSTLNSMNNLASLYLDLGRDDEAEPLYVETLAMRKRVLGDDHPLTLRSMNNLARLYISQGRHDEARPLVLGFMAAQKRRAEVSADAAASNEYAWMALTCEPADLRDPRSALEFSLAANERTRYENPGFLDTLALAYHLTGDTAKAIETQRRALALLPEDDARSRAEFEKRLTEFEATLN